MYHAPPVEYQNVRRRRGALHSFRQKKLHDGMVPPLMSTTDDESISPITTTQYTIDDTVCPPTDPDTLKGIVQKHIHTLPKYWKSKPIANHTAEAFEEALEFVIQRGQSLGEESAEKVKVILDCGCGTGRSSFLLGETHRDCIVIGIE
jgi:hypothetical protein